MPADTKIESMSALIQQDLTFRLSTSTNPTPISKAYDSSNDLYLTITDAAAAVQAMIKFELEIARAPGLNAIGRAQRVYTPHIIKVGFPMGVSASGAATLNNVVGAVASSGTLTTASVVVVTAAYSTATMANPTGYVRSKNTVTVVNAVAGKKVSINGRDFVASAAPAGDEWLSTGDDTADATALKNAINASVNVLIQGLVWATSAANVVTVYWIAPGTAGNAIGCVSDDASITVGGGGLVLEGGVDGHKATIATVDFFAMAEAAPTGLSSALTDGQWLVTGNDDADALAFENAVNASVNVAIDGTVTADSLAAVATITAVATGVGGNAITIAKTGNITLGNAAGGHLNSGVAADTTTVQGELFTAVASGAVANQFNVGVDDNASATNLASAINADAVLSLIVLAVPATNVVTITALDKTATHDAYTLAVTGSGITRSGATFGGYTAGSVLTIAGVSFLCVAASPTGSQWLASATESVAAANLAAAISGSVSVGIVGVVTAASDGVDTVTVTAVTPGLQGNLITFTKTGAQITLAPLTGVLAGGAVGSVPQTILATVIAECARFGCELQIFEDQALTISTFADATKLVTSFKPLGGLMAGV